MLKKIIVILIIVLVLGGVIAFLVLRAWNGGGTLAGSPLGTGSETSGIMQGAPSSLTVPQGSTITIGTAEGSVIVNNFYKNIIAHEDEFIVIAQTADYAITYDTMRSSFYIQLLGAGAQAGGEQAFLDLLGVSKADACKLKVSESGQAGLSFCPGVANQ